MLSLRDLRRHRRLAPVRRLYGWVRTAPARAAGAPRISNCRTVRVPMRDGTRLATDLYLPAGNGPWPAALIRTPYGRSALREAYGGFSESEIVLVAQDVRGRYGSAGKACPYLDEAWGRRQDGVDTVAWIRRQPWCTGKVATFGTSYCGINQLLLAGADPEGVVGQHVTAGPGSVYHHVWFQNGVFRKQLVEGWLKECGWPRAVLQLIRQHPRYDDLWAGIDLGPRVEQVRWPIVHVGGWYDYYAQGTLETFTRLQEHGGEGARGRQHLVMGPWTHSLFKREVGDLTFPANAVYPPGAPDRLEWLRFWLTGRPHSQAAARPASEPAVRYYVMGDVQEPGAPGNLWRAADRWPPPSRPLRLYFSDGGGLEPNCPARATTARYDHDPANPVPTLRGDWDGPADQRPVEARPDLCVFTTRPLPEPLEVTGRLWVRLCATSSARDTDFIITLTDVYPDGCSMLVAQGITRARLRPAPGEGAPLCPGRRYGYEIDMGSTSLIFNQDHRIRVSIASSSYPRYDPNPNTGAIGPFGGRQKSVVAQQAISIGGAEPSHLILPVIR